MIMLSADGQSLADRATVPMSASTASRAAATAPSLWSQLQSDQSQCLPAGAALERLVVAIVPPQREAEARYQYRPQH